MTAVTGKIANSREEFRAGRGQAQSQRTDSALQRDERLASQRVKLQLKAKGKQYSKMITLL